MDDFIGPVLPPHLVKALEEAREEVDESSSSNEEDLCDEEDKTYGPALPPHLKNKNIELQPTVVSSHFSSDFAPDNTDEDEEDLVIGPVLPGEKLSNSTNSIQEQLERRAAYIKTRMLDEKCKSGQEEMKRESWMLELPADRAAQFGLGPRQFRTRIQEPAGDKSVWTDTPADRDRKLHEAPIKEDVHSNFIKQVQKARDEEIDKLVESHSTSKRKESLLETHQKELKKKMKKEKESGKSQERRPFDRNVDLQVNRFDDAQKKAIFKKAQLLNDRFSSGETKYL